MLENVFSSVKPPLVYKTMIATMAAGKLFLWPTATPIFSSSNNWIGMIVGVPTFVGGALLAIAPKKLFQKTNTPMMGGPSSDSPLHTSHAFAYTRNPMYLGISIGLAGVALMTNCLWHLMLFPFLNALIMDTFYIPKEEKELLNKFGKDYVRYKNKVRRWI